MRLLPQLYHLWELVQKLVFISITYSAWYLPLIAYRYLFVLVIVDSTYPWWAEQTLLKFGIWEKVDVHIEKCFSQLFKCIFFLCSLCISNYFIDFNILWRIELLVIILFRQSQWDCLLFSRLFIHAFCSHRWLSWKWRWGLWLPAFDVLIPVSLRYQSTVFSRAGDISKQKFFCFFWDVWFVLRDVFGQIKTLFLNWILLFKIYLHFFINFATQLAQILIWLLIEILILQAFVSRGRVLTTIIIFFSILTFKIYMFEI